MGRLRKQMMTLTYWPRKCSYVPTDIKTRLKLYLPSMAKRIMMLLSSLEDSYDLTVK